MMLLQGARAGRSGVGKFFSSETTTLHGSDGREYGSLPESRSGTGVCQRRSISLGGCGRGVSDQGLGRSDALIVGLAASGSQQRASYEK